MSDAPNPSRVYPSRPIAGVGAVIMVSPGEATMIGWSWPTAGDGVVLVKRKFEPLLGQWTLPGGGIEVGETIEEAVVREMAEETGLEVEVGPIVEVFDRIVRDDDDRVKYHFVLIDYLCRPIGGRLVAGSDVADVTIADPEHLERYELNEKGTAVVRAAGELLRNRAGSRKLDAGS